MRIRDVLGLSLEALNAHRLRYRLSSLAVGVGIAAVVLMSSIGEGTRRFVERQISMFGTTLVSVNPGRVQTRGVPSGMGGGTRRLTIEDAMALARLPRVASATAVAHGAARVEWGDRSRSVMIFGVTAEMPRTWQMKVATGDFLPAGPWTRGGPVVVLGPRLARELFANESPLGRVVRVGTARFRVVGVMESKGMYLGFDLDELAYIPVSRALQLFNSPELNEIDLMPAGLADVNGVVAAAGRLMKERHRANDVTIMSQQDAQKVVGNILGVLSAVVTAIAGISLFVGAIGIFTILWIVVNERTAEIGLVKAIGGSPGQILLWYLTESAIVALFGGAIGLAAGAGGAALLGRIVPGLETFVSAGIVLVALLVSVGVGVLAGIAPAIRASRLDPVEALRTE